MNSKVIKIVASILSILVLVLGLGLILKFTGVGEKIDSSLNPIFSVEYDGKIYKKGDYELSLPFDETALFKINGTDNYSVKVTPNVAKKEDVVITIDGVDSYFADWDISNILVPKDNVHAKSFEVNCFDLGELAGKIYNSENISIKGSYKYPYLLTITSAEGDKVVFKLDVPIKVDGIELSESNIVF